VAVFLLRRWNERGRLGLGHHVGQEITEAFAELVAGDDGVDEAVLEHEFGGLETGG